MYVCIFTGILLGRENCVLSMGGLVTSILSLSGPWYWYNYGWYTSPFFAHVRSIYRPCGLHRNGTFLRQVSNLVSVMKMSYYRASKRVCVCVCVCVCICRSCM